MKPKPTAPRNPARQRAVPPPAEKQSPPPARETKVGLRLQVMHGRLPPGISIESKTDGDVIVWDGERSHECNGYVSMRVSIGQARGGSRS